MILPSVRIEQLYIKWDKKLILDADKVIVTADSDDAEAPNLPKIRKLFLELLPMLDYVKTIDIGSLKIGHIHVSVNLSEGKKGYLRLKTPEFESEADLAFSEHYLHLDLSSVQLIRRPVALKGDLLIDIEALHAYARVQSLIGSDAHLRLFASADDAGVDFFADTPKPVKDIRPIVDLTGLSKEITEWIVDRSEGEHVTLHGARGYLPYNNPAHLLDSLQASATYKKFAYTFAKALKPIRTASTELEFRDGFLNIYPKNALFYNHPSKRSWLNIDFKAPHTVLNAFIRVTSICDDDIIRLLKNYRINLPIKQTSGLTDADLTLRIELRNGHTTANGSFVSEEGDFLFYGTPLHITDAVVNLINADVAIETMKIDFQEWLSSDVEGIIHAAKNRGELRFTPTRLAVPYDKPVLALQTDAARPATLTYFMDPVQSSITLTSSRWELAGQPLDLSPLRAPFYFKSFSTSLPSTPFTLGKAAGRFGGDVNISQELANLSIMLDSFHDYGINLAQSPMSMQLQYRNGFHLASLQNSRWEINSVPLEIAPLQLHFQQSKVDIDPFEANINDTFKLHTSGNITTEANVTTISLEKPDMAHRSLGTVLESNDSLAMTFTVEDAVIKADAASLGLKANIYPKSWEAEIVSLATLAAYSPILREFNLSDGGFNLRADTEGYTFEGRIRYPYPLLVMDERDIYDYYLRGRHNDDNTSLVLNNRVKIALSKFIVIDANATGFNLPAIISYLDDHAQSDNGKTDRYVQINAANSFIKVSENRMAPADRITLYASKDSVYANLLYREGSATFEFEDGNFHLYGRDFDDAFMNSLLSLAEHKNGKLSFYLQGKPRLFNGVVKAENTVLKDYMVLNNVLAFINTVPSLATFSFPDYSSRGLKAKTAYAGFHYKEGNVSITDINVDAQELDIIGNGNVDFLHNRIAMKLNLKTDIGSRLSQVPLVGYLIFGKDGTVSTTLNIEGDLYNPKVSNALAEDIVVAPFNILKRAMTLPFYLLGADLE